MSRVLISPVDIIEIRRKPFPLARTRIGAHMIYITLRTVEEDA
jgi:hypothetical protein